MKTVKDIDTFELFKQYITGDFDNIRQVEEERVKGAQIHPHARHVNRVADHKIMGKPKNIFERGFWLIEESYYKWPGKELEIKPYIFYFSERDKNSMRLSVFNYPDIFEAEEIRNDNEALQLSIDDLIPSPTFKGAVYHRDGDKFHTNAPQDLGNGMTFTLIETFEADKLLVMELLEKNGQQLTPYDTPLIYDRV